MNTYQIDKVSSFRAVRAVLSDTMATSACPAFVPALTAFDKTLSEIDTMKTAQLQSVPASRAARNALLDDMQDAALRVAGCAANYADDHDLLALAFQVRLKPADFERARLERRIPIARNLHQAVEPVLAELADYGVTSEDLAALKTKIDAAEVALPAARSTVIDRKAATTGLYVAFRRMNAVLKHRVDPLVHSLRKTHPAFYVRYQAARQVVDRPGSRHGGAASATEPAALLNRGIAPVPAIPKAA